MEKNGQTHYFTLPHTDVNEVELDQFRMNWFCIVPHSWQGYYIQAVPHPYGFIDRCRSLNSMKYLAIFVVELKFDCFAGVWTSHWMAVLSPRYMIDEQKVAHTLLHDCTLLYDDDEFLCVLDQKEEPP